MREQPERRPFTPLGSLRFDYLFTAACLISIFGLYVDGTAHIRDKVPEEVFWTPYHFLMYFGFFAAAAVTFIGIVSGLTATTGVRGARAVLQALRISVGSVLKLRVPSTLEKFLPKGYYLGIWGLLVYGLAGAADFAIHVLFRIEADVEALFSPSHLLLFIGAALYRTGPLRAAWLRDGLPAGGWPSRMLWFLPAIISATFLLSSFSFFTQYINPFGLAPASVAYHNLAGIAVNPDNIPRGGDAEKLLVVGAASVVVYTAILMGFVLLLVSRWDKAVPLGTFTLMFTMNAVPMAWMRTRYHEGVIDPVLLVLVALTGGLLADWLFWIVKDKGINTTEFRLFAALAPSGLFLLYFGLILSSAGGIAWSPFVWGGLVFTSGGLGWVMTYLARLPRAEVAAAQPRTEPAVSLN